MSSSTARIVLKRGAVAVFGSSSRPAFFGCRCSSLAALFGCQSLSSRVFSSLAKSNGRRVFLDTLAMSEITRDASLSEFKSNLQNLLDHHFSLLQRETEKFRAANEKAHIELRSANEKAHIESRSANEKALIESRSANEKAHIELSKQISESKAEVLLEIHASRTQLESLKFQMIKYFIATLISIVASGLALLRIWGWKGVEK